MVSTIRNTENDESRSCEDVLSSGLDPDARLWATIMARSNAGIRMRRSSLTRPQTGRQGMVDTIQEKHRNDESRSQDDVFWSGLGPDARTHGAIIMPKGSPVIRAFRDRPVAPSEPATARIHTIFDRVVLRKEGILF